MNNGFDTDEEWNIPEGELVVNDFYTTSKLEVGKTYKVEYVVSFPEEAGMLDILPQSAREFTIYDISCVELLPKMKKSKELIPKGMSPSYFHILGKQRKGHK